MSEIFFNRYVGGNLLTYYPNNPVTFTGVHLNTGTYQDAVYGTAVPWTVTNLGTVGQIGGGTFGGVGNGIDLRAGGTVINGQPGTTSAYIYSAGGGDGVAITKAAGTVENYGTINTTDSNSRDYGIFFSDSGIVKNGLGGATGATIHTDSSSAVRIYGTSGAVINAGTITGGQGIALGGFFDAIDGTVTNEKTGYIGGGSGIYIQDNTATVLNLGTVEGSVTGVDVNGGTVTNGSPTDTSARLAGGGAIEGGNLTVTNYGTIEFNGNIASGNDAVRISGTGSVFNGPHGLITGYGNGVFDSDAATVSNFGSIVGSHVSGVGIKSGSVYNAATGTISGLLNGVYMSTGPGTLTNYGRIEGTPGPFTTGAWVQGDAKVANGSSSDKTAYIGGGNTGLIVVGVGTVSNYGTITGSAGGNGASLENGGNVDNGAAGSTSALIQGGWGIVIASSPSTITNFGTITGTSRAGIDLGVGGTVINAGTITGANGTAVSFYGSGGDRLIVDPGAVFAGQVVGADPTDTIELSGTASGTITGVGTSFFRFGTVEIDAGAKWRLVSDVPSAGTLFVGATVSGFGVNDTLDLTGIGDLGAGASIVGGQLDIADNGNEYLVNLADPTSYASDTFAVTADTADGILVGIVASVPPPTDLALGPASDSGTRGDDITNVVEPHITGLGQAGDTVDLYDGMTLVGTGRVDAKGDWNVMVDAPLGNGQHTLTATESSKNGGTSAASAPLVVMIDTTPPAPPSAPILESTAGGFRYGNEITNLAKPTLTGTAGAGMTVKLYNGATLIGTGKADTQGVWTITTAALAPGSYNVTATATDTTVGNTSMASSATPLTVLPATQGAIEIGAANSDIVLGAGNFAVNLGSGDHTLQAGVGSSIFQGGNGNDSLSLGNGSDTVTLGNGNDQVYGGNGNDIVSVGSGGGGVTLGNGNNIVRDSGGNDWITVGAGSNQIDGGTGNDLFALGNGHDTVSGSGTDIFDLNAGRYDISGGGADTLVLDSSKGQFTIDDYNPARDQIQFLSTGFDLGVDNGQAIPPPQAISASLFSSNTNGTFATTGNRFAYDQATGKLYYDAEGSEKGSTRVLLGTLENAPHLTAADLFFFGG